MPVGYSGTPLAKKLGINSGFIVRLVGAPDYYLSLFTNWPTDIRISEQKNERKNLIHFFTKDSSELYKVLPELKKEILANGTIWVSWPKKTSKVVTDVSENMIRDLALNIGLVDVKVCAVDEIWSGLKLVIPVKDRK
ncbi:MAG TPA: DUF3052 family protein [Flavipsychrobacter sp.]|nr:DUF3052 family protein [Flavipsychrobacter sp.]